MMEIPLLSAGVYEMIHQESFGIHFKLEINCFGEVHATQIARSTFIDLCSQCA
jgi:hypothetical protein